MADGDRDAAAEEMRANGFDMEAAQHLIEGLIDEDAGLLDEQEPDESEEIEEEEEAEDDASDESDEVEVEDAEDDEDSDETSDDEEPARIDLTDEMLASLVTIKVDGKETEVPLSEALAGTMRHKAFTQKTQRLAEQQKAADAMVEAVRAEQQKYAQGLSELAVIMRGVVPAEPDWEKVKAESPDEYPDLFRNFQAHKQQVEAIEAEQARVEAEAEAEYLERRAKTVADERERLTEALDLVGADEEARVERLTQLRDYAVNVYGYSVDELAGVIDHRPLLMLDKARRYDEMVAKGKEVRTKAKKAVVLKPGSTGGKKSSGKKRAEAARSRLSKTGDLRDAAGVLESMLD